MADQPSLFEAETATCRRCGGDGSDPNHWLKCDGQQGKVEAAFDPTVDVRDVPQVVEDTDAEVREGTIAERAERFHRRNPAVYRFAVSVCRFMQERRIQHYGMKAVWEVMRFKYLETHGDIYKLNNNYTAFYARLIMAQEPDLADFFTTRDCPNDTDYHTRPVR